MRRRLRDLTIYFFILVSMSAVGAEAHPRIGEGAADLTRRTATAGRKMISITDKNAIVVDESAVDSTDPDYDIVQANIDFLNDLLAQYIRFDEMSPEALRSYKVDYYLAQMENGGFPQLVFNSRWHVDSVRLIREGLAAIGAKKHLALFEEGSRLVDSLGEARLKKFLATTIHDYGESTERAALEGIDDRFFALDKMENLRDLNRVWLRAHPLLAPASAERIAAEVRRRGEELPDRAKRIAAAEAAAPRYMKLIRALVAKAGQRLDRVTVGDPTREFAGAPTTAWYFLTDRGLFHMVDVGGIAIMFRGRSTTDRVCEIDAP